jgi:monovalent cation:H+ antiporter-2, CPA2 family
MDHEPVLITTIAVGLVAAFVGGLLARRVGLPSIVGYIVAGVVIGPFTPGLIADRAVATELAEIGIILLMFGVGIEFSVKDLLAVRSIAIPGALIQAVVATALGIAFGLVLGWGVGGGIVLGLAIAVASTVVLLRAMTDRQELYTAQGRIAIGWLIVEDILMVIVLVALPSIAPLLGGTASTTLAADLGFGPIGALVVALAKTALFALLMIVFGARVVPWLLTYVSRQGSRELFTLAVLAIALGLAFTASVIFGVSFALGAFLAGAVVAESDLSHQAAADALPLRDAFAVLFFVSVGMLVDPAYLLANPLPILAVLLLIVVAKALLKFVTVILAGYPVRVSLTVAAGLAQIGEFSFILGTVGVSLGLLPVDGFQLIVAGALLSITLNPFLFDAINPLESRLRDNGVLNRIVGWRAGDLAVLQPAEDAALRGHAILSGFGRVGRMIGPALERRGFTYVVITLQRQEVDQLRARGIPAIYGDASNQEILERAHVRSARVVIVASSDAQSSYLIVQRAVAANPAIDVVVRTHSDDQAAQLRAVSPKVQAVHGERELGVQMARYSLRRFGVPTNEAEAIAQGLRQRGVR